MSPPIPFLLTKILATIGPASADPATLVRLVEEGTRAFRINFSHGDFESFGRLLAAAREAGERTGQFVGVLGDLCGPKIRVGAVREGGIELSIGDRVEFCRGPLVAGEGRPAGWQPTETEGVVFSTTFPAMIDEVQPGHRLLIDDGNVRCLVIDHAPAGRDADQERRLVCHVTVGGRVTSAKGINLPDTPLSVPAYTQYDLACVEWALANRLDYLALSFVRRAEDLRQLKQELSRRGATGTRAMPIIAKIEKPQALDDLDGIVAEAEGIMVARGDLGVEMDLAEVPVIQKRLIALAHDYGKPVIVATQMLQSMVDLPTPTRAEVSDVANAIFDGADAVMLSGETAIGQYPVQTVHVMGRIVRTTQAHLGLDNPGGSPPRKLQETRYRTAALAHGVSTVVRDLDARLIVTWSELGGSARYLSQNRPAVPIIAASSNPEALRRMSLLFGVVPLHMPRPASSEAFVRQIDALILERGWASAGDAVVIAKGEPIGTPGVTNELLIHYVGDVTRLGWHARA